MRIQAKYAGKCAKCDGLIAWRETVEFDPESRRCFHIDCAPEPGLTGETDEQKAERLGFKKV